MRAYDGVPRAEPQVRVQGAEPLVGRGRGLGAKPPEADVILVLEHTFL